MLKKCFLLILILFLNRQPTSAITGYEQTIKEGIFLNYYDLVQLSKTRFPQGDLLQKLSKQLTTPIIQQPPLDQAEFLHSSSLRDFIRVTSWNIERGFNVDLIEKIFEYNPDALTEAQKEASILSNASILVLNEVDIGVLRTDYENIAERLASKLKMGYVFGTEFIEVDPYQLGIKPFTKEERVFLETKTLEKLDDIDESKYRGLHGTAILTKYSILNAKIIRLPDCYKWYKEELQKISTLELARRETAEKIFSAKILSELRHGGRMALIVDLLLLNNEKITVVATHLENRCLPKCRAIQFEHLLNNIKHITHPLILAGDLNTTGADASPVTIKKEVLKRVKDPEFIAKQAIASITPLTFTQNLILGTVNAIRQFKDPTTKNIPIILPNKERKIFTLLQDFRFADGKTFDLRGTPGKSYKGHYAFLSNSNERDIKGYKPTFELDRNLGIAQYKLDWIFVKPLDLKDSYTPHFGRTLRLANRIFGKEISDHDPITVDILVK